MLFFFNKFRVFLFLFLIICGAFLRIKCISCSLWLDEAWVANSAYSDSLKNVFWYKNWYQTSPPLFLLLIHLQYIISGYNPDIIRFIPLLFGIGSIFILYKFASKFLNNGFTLFATSLFVFSPALILYSQQLKQYSSDLFVTILILYVYLNLLREPTSRNWWIIVFAQVFLVFLSFQTVIALPILFLALLKKDINYKFQFKLNFNFWEILVGLVVIFCSLLGVYIFFILPNTGPDLYVFWKSGFPPTSDLAATLSFYYNKFLVLINVIPIKIPLVQFDNIVISFFYFFGIFNLIYLDRGEGLERYKVSLLFILPIFTATVLNLLNIYPLDLRLSLFLFPAILLPFVYGVQHAFAKVADSFKIFNFYNLRSNFLFCIGILLTFLSIMSSCYEILNYGLPKDFRESGKFEDVKGSMGYLYYNSDLNDILYVHASMREQFDLYYPMYPIVAKKIIPGNVGFPCCPRNSGEKYDKNDNVIDEDIHKITQTHNVSVIRLLFTGRQAHWQFLHRQDPKEFNEKMLAQGFQHLKSITSFKGVLIEEYKPQN